MAKFQIDASYSYSAEIEADTAEEAEQMFLDNLNQYYVGTEEFEIEEIEDDEDEDTDGE